MAPRGPHSSAAQRNAPGSCPLVHACLRRPPLPAAQEGKGGGTAGVSAGLRALVEPGRALLIVDNADGLPGLLDGYGQGGGGPGAGGVGTGTMRSLGWASAGGSDVEAPDMEAALGEVRCSALRCAVLYCAVLYCAVWFGGVYYAVWFVLQLTVLSNARWCARQAKVGVPGSVSALSARACALERRPASSPACAAG